MALTVPGARWVTLPSGERRAEVVLDVGLDPATGKRRQARRRFRTAAEANDAYAEMRGNVSTGTFVARSPDTVAEAVGSWLAGRHGLRPKTLAGYSDVLKPVVSAYGAIPLRQLTKQHVVTLVESLRAGTLTRTNRQARRPWKPRTVNLFLFTLGQVLDDAAKQGLVARNVAALVDRLPQAKTELHIFTQAEVSTLLSVAESDRLEHAWHLALYGLRRGEVAGLRWADVDYERARLTIRASRVTVDGKAVESLPKTERGSRFLPLTADLVTVLHRAQVRQADERWKAGRAATDSGYVVTNELGEPHHPETLSGKWELLLRKAGVRSIRLHDARHTCGALLHLQGVPIAVISAWLGHADAAFTMRT